MALTDKLKNSYKSKGERQIAGLLERYGIPFIYEKETLIRDRSKIKIWYPDFYLPEQKIYVEYFGINGDPGYRDRTKHKLKVFRENRLDLIPVYPNHMREGLEPYLLGEIHEHLKKRHEDFRNQILERRAFMALRAPMPAYPYQKGEGYQAGNSR